MLFACLCQTCQNLEPRSKSGLNLMQKRRAIGVEMLLNKQESPPVVFLNASNSEDAVVDDVYSVGFCLFFCFLGSLD